MRAVAQWAFPAVLAAVAAQAQDAPNSAIEWLSETIKNPPNFAVAPDSKHTAAPLINETALDPAAALGYADAVGILPTTLTGFPADLWGDTSAERAAEILRAHTPGPLPEARALFLQLLLAQADPPAGASRDPVILLARIDQLVKLGTLDAAEALVSLAGDGSAELFARRFEIGLLTNRTQPACDLLRAEPRLSEDISTRVFCLARSGDWNAAATTLSLSATIGHLDPKREELLIRFLDPELFEGAKDPPPPTPLTAMDFFLREAVALPRPSGVLPLPFLYGDTGLRVPLRMRIEASERLVAAGALPANVLFAAYRGGRAASAGGPWGRVDAVQKLDKALLSGDAGAIAESLAAVYEKLAAVHLVHALAQEYAAQLELLSPEPALEPVADIIAVLLLLAGTDAGVWAEGSQDPDILFAQGLHAGLTLEPAGSLTAEAIAAGFRAPAPASAVADRLISDLAAGRFAPAVLGALDILTSGRQTDPQGIQASLFLLRQAGLNQSAQDLAMQLLLLPANG